MPTYVYRCPKDGRETEMIHGMTDNPAVLCSCGQEMRRKPQVFRWGVLAAHILRDQLHDEYVAMRARKGKRRNVRYKSRIGS